MSAVSGIAAVGVALALGFVALGQSVWDWRYTGSSEIEEWRYSLFGVEHTVTNRSTNAVTRTAYTYYDLPGQPRMSALFIELGRWFAIAVLLAGAGLGLSVATMARKLRGIFAGLAFLGACAAALYAGLNFVFAVPAAAADLPNPAGQPILDFKGQYFFGSESLAWTPAAGWFLLLGMGLLFAWSSSEMWHLRVARRPAIPRPEAKPVPATAAAAPSAPVVQVLPEPAKEPVIDEVFIIAPSGLLVKHMSRSLLSDKDRDVVGGMISVVSNFVRDAFTEKDGVVQEIQLGGHRFVMFNEGGLVLAVLAGDGPTEAIMHRLRHLAACLLDRYGTRLTSWDGEPLEGIEDELGVLWEPFFVPPPPAE